MPCYVGFISWSLIAVTTLCVWSRGGGVSCCWGGFLMNCCCWWGDWFWILSQTSSRTRSVMKLSMVTLSPLELSFLPNSSSTSSLMISSCFFFFLSSCFLSSSRRSSEVSVLGSGWQLASETPVLLLLLFSCCWSTTETWRLRDVLLLKLFPHSSHEKPIPWTVNRTLVIQQSFLCDERHSTIWWITFEWLLIRVMPCLNMPCEMLLVGWSVGTWWALECRWVLTFMIAFYVWKLLRDLLRIIVKLTVTTWRIMLSVDKN